MMLVNTSSRPRLWQINRRHARYGHIANFNLLHDLSLLRRPFDVIFCRNVLIYFRSGTKLTSSPLAKAIEPAAFWVLGAAEPWWGWTSIQTVSGTRASIGLTPQHCRFKGGEVGASYEGRLQSQGFKHDRGKRGT